MLGKNLIEHLKTNGVGQRRTAPSRVLPKSWIHIFKTPKNRESEGKKNTK